MQIRTEKVFHGISKELIKNAKIEIEAKRIIEKEGLKNEETGCITEKCYKFFTKNHRSDLTVYKHKKQSGYSLIVLYKGVVRVGSADFMTSFGKKMEESFSISEDWPVYQLYELKRKVFCNLFDDPYDHRTTQKFKPSTEKFWNMLKECIMS